MKVNFNFLLKDLAGNEIPNAEANKIIANMLSGLNKGNSIKLWDWAMTIYKGIDLEIDSTDTDVLKGLIENSDSLTVLSKGQIIKHIDDSSKK